MKSINSQDLWETSPADVYHGSFYQFKTKYDSTNNYTILIVDNNHSIRKLICLYFKTLGYNVLLADTGLKALEFVKLYAVDMVFLDIQLPYINGLAVCTAMRELSEIPIIMLTALYSLDNAATTFRCGADGYITKPFQLSTLKLRVQGLLHNGHVLV